MDRWLTTVCHYWPGITPWNVYTLRYDQWCRFVLDMEAMERERARANEELPGHSTSGAVSAKVR